jgi:hypothetical protein
VLAEKLQTWTLLVMKLIMEVELLVKRPASERVKLLVMKLIMEVELLAVELLAKKLVTDLSPRSSSLAVECRRS